MGKTIRAGWLSLALVMGWAGAAGAVVLAELEANDTAASATGGGTVATTSLSGALTEGEIDYYQFVFAGPVASFRVFPLTPAIAFSEAFDAFSIVIRDSADVGIASCGDCWFSGSSALAVNLPAGTYYVSITDTNAHGGDSLGAYTAGVEIVAGVPEPGTLALLGAGLLGLGAARRLRRQ